MLFSMDSNKRCSILAMLSRCIVQIRVFDRLWGKHEPNQPNNNKTDTKYKKGVDGWMDGFQMDGCVFCDVQFSTFLLSVLVFLSAKSLPNPSQGVNVGEGYPAVGGGCASL